MKLTGRAKRMEHFKKLHGNSGLNLVSLMDIFTILVFFLLVSSSNVRQIPTNTKIILPTSTAEKTPKETIIITITKVAILVQGAEVAKINNVLNVKLSVIDTLIQELKYQSSKSTRAGTSGKSGKAVTIMGDEDIPYQLLRKILASCREANYTQIAFAAMQKAKGKV